MRLRSIDLPLMLASLVLSLFLWVVVQVQLGAKTVVLHVPLKLLNRPEKVSVDGAPPTVDIETIATSDQSDWLDEHKLELFASTDLKGVTPGTHKLLVSFHHPNSDLAFLLKTKSVLVNVERYVTRRLPVSVSLKGDLPTEKKSWVTQEVMPAFVEVSGPEGLVDEAVAKVEVDRTHYQDGQIQTPVKLVDKGGDLLDGLTASPDTITVKPLVLPVKTVPLAGVHFIGAPPIGFKVGILELFYVQVRGPQKVLDGLKSIQLPPVYLNGLTTSTRVTLQPILPAKVELLGGKTVTITIPIEVDNSQQAPLLPPGITGGGSTTGGNTVP